jgi:hypothetical protein
MSVGHRDPKRKNNLPTYIPKKGGFWDKKQVARQKLGATDQ